MKGKWIASILAVWVIAFLAGSGASAQSCLTCSADGIGLDHYGITTLASCSATSDCMQRDCTIFYTFTDANGNQRCAGCYSHFPDVAMTPQSAMRCITFVWETPP